MLTSLARAPALALLGLSLVSACGDDEVLPDGSGGRSPDASVDSGPADSGEDLCPGQFTFEALVADAVAGDPVFEVEVAEVGASNTVESAPNGRAVLCLPEAADSQVRSTLPGYLARLDTLSADAALTASSAARPYPLDVLDAIEADRILTDLGPERDINDSLLLVSVLSYPDGLPLVGATVSIDVTDSDGAFARDERGQFAADPFAEIGAGRLLLFANVALTGGTQVGRAVVTVTPPEGFRGACVGPPSVELEPGGVSGVLFACQ